MKYDPDVLKLAADIYARNVDFNERYVDPPGQAKTALERAEIFYREAGLRRFVCDSCGRTEWDYDLPPGWNNGEFYLCPNCRPKCKDHGVLDSISPHFADVPNLLDAQCGKCGADHLAVVGPYEPMVCGKYWGDELCGGDVQPLCEECYTRWTPIVGSTETICTVCAPF